MVGRDKKTPIPMIFVLQFLSAKMALSSFVDITRSVGLMYCHFPWLVEAKCSFYDVYFNI